VGYGILPQVAVEGWARDAQQIADFIDGVNGSPPNLSCEYFRTFSAASHLGVPTIAPRSATENAGFGFAKPFLVGAETIAPGRRTDTSRPNYRGVITTKTPLNPSLGA
jgi:hypothetical protein